MNSLRPKEILLSVIHDALKEVDPREVVKESVSYDPSGGLLTVQGREFSVGQGQEIYVLGSGKASAAMGQALEEILGGAIRKGLIITPAGTNRDLKYIELREGSHPLPDIRSLEATRELVGLAQQIPEGSLVFCLISGGTSALLCLPAAGLELQEVAETQQLLLNSGADIHDMNAVRTALSAVKGGGLLRYLSHTVLLDLIISDVPGDDFRSIGSGPTTPGGIDFERASRVLGQYKIWDRVPQAVRVHIEKGVEKGMEQGMEQAIEKGMEGNPSPGSAMPQEHHQFLVSSARKLAESVAGRFRRLGFGTQIVIPAYNDPIGEVETMIVSGIGAALKESGQAGPASVSKEAMPPPAGKTTPVVSSAKCLIWFGESSVTVTGSGKGGRNQELALRIARHLSPGDSVTVASVGTDGVDGPTDAAGAVVDGHTLPDAVRKGLDPEAFLENNDAWTFFDRAGGLIRTGPTGNNLMDLQVALIGDV